MADGPLLYNAAALAAVLGANGPQVLFKYAPQGTLSSNPGFGGTFTNASANGVPTYVDVNGVVQSVNTNIIRDAHYIGGVRTTLLEGSRTNICLRSEDFTAAAWTTASVDTTPTGSATTGPNGVAASATLLTEGVAGTAQELQVVTGTSNATYSVSRFVKRSNTDWYCLSVFNGANIARAWFNLATGAKGSTSAAGTAVVSSSTITSGFPNSFFRVTLTASVGSAATAISFSSFNTSADNVTTRVNNAARYEWGAMFEDNTAFPSSYIATGASAVTRAADALSFPFSPVPQALTVYAKMIDVGESAVGAATRTGTFGNVGSTSAESFYFSTPNGKLSINHIAAAGSGSSTQTAAVNAAYDTVEALGSLSAAGVPQLTYSFNGAAEVSPAAGIARALDAAWNASTVWLTGQSAAATTFYAFQKLVIVSGVQSLATMRAL